MLRSLAWLLAALLLWPIEARAEAGDPHGRASDAGECRRKSKRKRGKRKRRRRGTNMPPGWTWPPDEATLAQGEACKQALRGRGVEFEDAEPMPKIATPIVLRTMAIDGLELHSLYKEGPFPMDCQLALAFASGPAAALRAHGVREVHFSSIYAYRRVRRRRVLSRHALGLAMDIFVFKSEDGEEHVVKRDYRKDPWLRDLEARLNETGWFRRLLTPGNDRGHRDHFHVEARTDREHARTAAARP